MNAAPLWRLARDEWNANRLATEPKWDRLTIRQREVLVESCAAFATEHRRALAECVREAVAA